MTRRWLGRLGIFGVLLALSGVPLAEAEDQAHEEQNQGTGHITARGHGTHGVQHGVGLHIRRCRGGTNGRPARSSSAWF